MFKSISNNFGTHEITFRDFQTGRYVVLNARFQYDPTNEAYLAASELEIKVPALSLSKSTDAGVFAVYKDERTYQWDDTPSRYHFATVLRSRIRTAAPFASRNSPTSTATVQSQSISTPCTQP